jgi:hypothetical protein
MPTMTIERATSRDDELRVRAGRVRFLTIPNHRFVMIDGSGPPDPAAFEARMPGLYGTAYGLRFALKKRGIERRVGPLEGLWWTSDGVVDLDAIFARDDRGTWRWTLMIALPHEATDDEIAEHLEAARARLDPEVAGGLRCEAFAEGDVAQILHVGPYADERPTIERLHAAIADAGFRPTGRHHELYLGDPRRAKPEKLRTLLRMPVTT